jgi:hypothetical protein
MTDFAPDPRGYAAQRNAQLPWGYWARQDPAIDGLIDEDGTAWPSLRHYFWQARLGMPSLGSYKVDEGCELLLSILHALMNRMTGFEAAVADLFGGGWQSQRHYMAWLQGQGMIKDREVTVEGRAAARMLAATRSVNAPDLAPLDFPTLAGMNGLDRGRTRKEREQVMAAQEALGRALRYRFVREPVAGKSGIKLIGHEMGDAIPLTRVLWALSFPDDYARDRLFGWLAHHLDRWQAWGEMAADGGSRSLTEHLLLLRFADERIDLG